MWHIGFLHWNVPATQVVKGLIELKQLRADGLVTVDEWPAAANVGANDYNFDSLQPPHVVNCPTPMTIDTSIHKVRQLEQR